MSTYTTGATVSSDAGRVHTQPAAQARVSEAPLAADRHSYLAYRCAIGGDGRNLRSLAATLIRVVNYLDLDALRPVTEREIQDGARRWAQRPRSAAWKQAGPFSEKVFATAARGFLRFHGLYMVEPKPQPFQRELQQYIRFLTNEKGLAASTIQSYNLELSLFLRWLGKREKLISDLLPVDLGAFIAYRSETCRKSSLPTTAQPLRGFLLYGARQGWFRSDLGESLRFPNRQRVNPSVVIPTWESARQIVDDSFGDNPADIRSRAILLLCAVYGLRSSEVARLRLQDLNWRDETMTVLRSKSGRTQQFPIQHEIGEAILKYIQLSRPCCYCKTVFVSRNRPFRPITPTTINLITAKRFERFGIAASGKGPHMLRHACATRLLHTGSSLREIADFLGHRGLSTVSVYVRCDIKALSAVADISLSDLA